MKTLDEVIKANECCDHGESDSRCEDCPYNGIGACCAERESDALQWLKGYRAHIELDKLRDKCETENEPLSWDELKLMEGKPVWVEGDHGCIWGQKAWSLIRLDPENDDIVICINTDNGVHYEFAIGQEDYGTDWQAYRKERE